jgi:hypothetical protein
MGVDSVFGGSILTLDMEWVEPRGLLGFREIFTNFSFGSISPYFFKVILDVDMESFAGLSCTVSILTRGAVLVGR